MNTTPPSAQTLVQQAQARGLLPPDAAQRLPAPPPAPSWVVAGLSFIGSLMVLLPLLGFLAVVAYNFFFDGAGASVLGALLLSGGVLMLRQRDLPMLAQQLAFNALLAGLALWGIGNGFLGVLELEQGLNWLLLQLIALSLLIAAFVPQAWVQRLMGLAATMLALWLDFEPGMYRDYGVLLRLYAPSLTFLTALWAVWCALEPRLGHWRHARRLATLADGAGVALLLSAAWVAGRQYVNMLAWGTQPPGSADWQQILPMPSTGLAMQAALLLGGAAWLAWHWRLRWHNPATPLLALTVLALLAGGWAMPQMGAIGLIGLIALGTGRRRTLWLAGLTLLAGLSGLYYALHWPLTQKAALLATVGAGLALGLWLLRKHGNAHTASPAAAPATQTPGTPWQRVGAIATAAATVLALGLVQWNVQQKEQVLTHGQKVFVSLAPVDPRSLMQGDYMALNFDLPTEVRHALEAEHFLQKQMLVQARLDARGVAEVQSLHTPGQPVPEGWLLLPAKNIKGRWTLVTDAYFFPEGQGHPLAQARFGEFRALPNGRALLVGLADENLQAIQPGPPPDDPLKQDENPLPATDAAEAETADEAIDIDNENIFNPRLPPPQAPPQEQ